jgi:four helix bundle protein
MEAGRAPLRSHKELRAYQLAMDLLVRVHRLIDRLPREERYELGSQMRRASRSIPANIAEGFAKRQSTEEFQHYMRTAMGSANEMETHLRIAAQLGYIVEPKLRELIDGYDHVGRQLNRLIATWRRF